MLASLPKLTDPNVLVGIDTSDDAGVYKLSEDVALVQTLDFFSPMTDDPYLFGQIAAANSLSDVYAMGGTPLTALNIVCYAPCIPLADMGQILRGGAEMAAEAGVVILGGHTVENADVKYGMSVTGIVRPDRIITNTGARPNDKLILTKPLGTGIVATAFKAGLAADEHIKDALMVMAQLNKTAALTLVSFGVRGGTDITGFGLLGHAVEVAQGSGVGIVIDTAALPMLPGSREYASMGLVPGGAYRNREHFGPRVSLAIGVPEDLRDILFSPETSGGLFFAVPSQVALKALELLHERGVVAAIVGECITEHAGQVRVR